MALYKLVFNFNFMNILV